MLKKIGVGLLSLAASVLILTLAVLGGYQLFFLITGTRFTETQVGSAGAWASAVGATALAVASVWLAMQANEQARKAEERAEALQTKAEKSRIRDEEIHAIRQVAEGADLFINSVRRYYDTVGAILHLEESERTVIMTISAKADFADAVSESLRLVDSASFNLETEVLIKEYVMMTSLLMAIKREVQETNPIDHSSQSIRTLLSESSESVSRAKENLFYITRMTHAATDIRPILKKVQAEVDTFAEQRGYPKTTGSSIDGRTWPEPSRSQES